MKRELTSLIIAILLISFTVFVKHQKSTNLVLGIINPTTIQVDLNQNNIIDDNETVCIPDIQTYTINLSEHLKSSQSSEELALGYLTDEYSRNLLYLKQVKVKLNGNKTPNCLEGEIFIENEKYSDKLFHSGFAKRNNQFNHKAHEEKINLAQKLNLVILNLKSFKYHHVDCEYGVQSSDYIIIPKRQLPKEAQACKFCHTHRIKTNSHLTTNNTSSDNLKLVLTDFTTQLKPHRNCTSEVCKSILNELKNAQDTIDIAIYGWDNIPDITNTILEAKRRGVRLRIVYDETSNNKFYYKDTHKLVSISDVSKSDKNIESNTLTDQLMHNKFIVIDNKITITGSMNYSSTGLSGFNANSILIIDSKEISKLYTTEFEQMLSGKFHNQKTKLPYNKHFHLNNGSIDIYFSPYDKTSEKIIPLINSAKEYIYVPTFLITHKKLSEALINAKQRGVEIKIIIDANSTATRNTKHAQLRANGIDLKTENYAGKMHSKSMIIDDQYIILGSMNFSNSGENKNDENTVIINDTKLAKHYKEFFMYLWNKIPDRYLTQNVRPESKDSVGSCSDGIDNDFDGLIDSADTSCK